MDTRSRTMRLLILLLATAALAAGCGNGSNSSASPTNSEVPASATTTGSTSPRSSGTTSSTRVGTTSTSTRPAEQQEVVDAYVAAMSAFEAALADPPNPDHPALAQTMGDPLLTEVRNLAGKWRGFGQAGRFPDNSVHRTEVLSVEVKGDTATLEVCVVDDGILYEPATGRVLDEDVSTARDRATLSRADGIWRLTTREQLEKWEGVAGCAVATS